MRWLFKSAILTAGRFAPPAVIYLAGATHYKTDLVAAYILAVNSGQISAQLAECGLSARLARVGTGHLSPYWRALAGRFLVLSAIAAVALEMNLASAADLPVAFGMLMLTIVRDVAVIERDVPLLAVDAVCGVLGLVVFALPMERASFLWTIGAVYTLAGLVIIWYLFRPPPSGEAAVARYTDGMAPQNVSDWASYTNRVLGLLVSGFDLQLIARAGFGAAALTRYAAARSVLQIGAVAAAYGQTLIGVRLYILRGVARPQAMLLRVLAAAMAAQGVLLLTQYERRWEVWHMLAAFTLASGWTLIYSVYLPTLIQRGRNQAILLASLVSSVSGFAVMLLASRQLGVAGVAYGVAVTKFVFCEMTVRKAARYAGKHREIA
jgi:hypothetical protein